MTNSGWLVSGFLPNDGVCRHDELRLVGEWVLEQFTVGLNEDVSLFRQS